MGDPYVALNGKRVISAKITIPYYGAWVADVLLAASDTIALASTLKIADLTLIGHVYRMASFSGSRSARLVGGFGGWRTTLPAQAYQNDKGLKLSLILGDAASTIGEKINIATDVTLGTLYVRENAPAERLLRQLAGPTWWIDSKGVTQIGPRTGGAILSQFNVVEWSGAKGSFQIATETVSDWLPARTFTSPTVTKSQTVGMTKINVDNEGTLRLMVLSAGAGSQ